jgi:hypothetical protein
MVNPNCSAENREGQKFCAKCGRHGEWLVAQGCTPEAAALLEEAREIFDRLKARPWLERVAAGQRHARVPA